MKKNVHAIIILVKRYQGIRTARSNYVVTLVLVLVKLRNLELPVVLGSPRFHNSSFRSDTILEML